MKISFISFYFAVLWGHLPNWNMSEKHKAPLDDRVQMTDVLQSDEQSYLKKDLTLQETAGPHRPSIDPFSLKAI